MPSTVLPGRTLPIQDSLTEPFWRGARDCQLLLPLSPETGQICWPPRRFPPVGSADPPTWIKASGMGVIYTFSVVHRSSHAKPPVPYVLAVVALAEGAYMTTNIINVDPDSVYIGMPVTVAFEELQNGERLPVFTPIAAESRLL